MLLSHMIIIFLKKVRRITGERRAALQATGAET